MRAANIGQQPMAGEDEYVEWTQERVPFHGPRDSKAHAAPKWALLEAADKPTGLPVGAYSPLR